jgi:hypothetical protein
MKSRNIPALKVANYFMIYCAYLLENGLPDDSKTIKVADLVYFVEEYIDESDHIRLTSDKNLIQEFVFNHN